MFWKGSMEIDKAILKSIISLFFLSGNNVDDNIDKIEFLSSIIVDLKINSIDPKVISELAREPYPTRYSANFLNDHLNNADKILLMLKVFQFVVRYKIHTYNIGSIEMIKVLDLLRINVNLFDDLIDFFCGKKASFILDHNGFWDDVFDISFNSSLLFSNENGDVDISSKSCKIIFHKLYEDYIVSLTKVNNTQIIIAKFVEDRAFPELNNIILTKSLLTKMFQNKVLDTSQLISSYSENELIFQEENHFTLCLPNKRRSRNKIKRIRKLYLDGYIGAKNKNPVIDLYKSDQSSNLKYELHIVEYMNGLITSQVLHENSIAILEINRDKYNLIVNNSNILVNNKQVNGQIEINSSIDILTWKNVSYKILKSGELVKHEIVYETLNVKQVKHYFNNKILGLTDVSFKLNKGEIAAIMGPSGSGKTTLLKVLNGELSADEVNIQVDDMDFIDKYKDIIKNIGYVPQSDLLFNNLTVFQNMFFYAKIRSVGRMKGPLLADKIDSILNKVGLLEKKNLVVGNEEKKVLSGGERKRLNIALELLFDPAIFILDEPTSGLSSKDSEQLLSILSDLKFTGKIILTTIHQPSSLLFSKFDKLLFLDKQGVVVYFGDVSKAFDYFDEELKQIIINKKELTIKKERKNPDYFFDIVEYKTVNSSKDKHTERLFPRNYWKKKRESKVLMEQFKGDKNKDSYVFSKEKKNKNHSLVDKLIQFWYCFFRDLHNSLSSIQNIIMLSVVPFLLGLFTSVLLKNSSGTNYSFWDNGNIPHFNFISILIFIFLGLSGSIYEILPEKLIIVREKKVGLSALSYLVAKLTTLEIFNIIQTLLYVFITTYILEIKGHFWVYFTTLNLSGLCGISIGLFSSATIKERKSLLMVLPLTLIPMIIFGGAIIPFSSMNKNLKINSKREVPEFCEVIPTKWLFENITLNSVNNNQRSRVLKDLDNKLKGQSDLDLISNLTDQKNAILSLYPHDNYINKSNSMLVDFAHVKSMKDSKNHFISKNYIVFNNKYSTRKFAESVIIVFCLIFNLITLKKIRNF